MCKKAINKMVNGQTIYLYGLTKYDKIQIQDGRQHKMAKCGVRAG